MGWSGYTIGLDVRVLVDAHAGERERVEEALYREMGKRCWDAVAAIIAEPQYACLTPDGPYGEWEGQD